MRISTADTIRGTSTCVVAGVMTILMPASELPHKFGYYAAVAAFLLGLRFGLRAIGMFFICCVAIGIAEATGRGVCTPNSNAFKCGFEAAAPFLIFGYFIFPTIAGVVLGGIGQLSGMVVSDSARTVFHGRPKREAPLRLGHTVAVALAAAAMAFVVFALLPLSGAPLLLPSLAACVACGLAPSYGAERAPVRAARADIPTW